MHSLVTVRTAWRGLVAAVAGAALVGLMLLGGEDIRRPLAGLSPPPAIAGTTATASYCTARTRNVVGRFTRAIREGSASRADKAFAQEPGFEWYSTSAPGERFNAAAQDRTTLRNYFESRVADDEWLRLTRRLNTAYDRGRNITHFHGTVERSAADLTKTAYTFKGAAKCAGATRIIVWSMAPKS